VSSDDVAAFLAAFPDDALVRPPMKGEERSSVEDVGDELEAEQPDGPSFSFPSAW
jgi:hypothetical protein